jgi:hypothetical protein
MNERFAQIRALARLARTQSRLSVQYRQWAAEAELAGRLDAYHRWSKEAAKLRTNAKWHIHQAMITKDYHYGA